MRVTYEFQKHWQGLGTDEMNERKQIQYGIPDQSPACAPKRHVFMRFCSRLSPDASDYGPILLETTFLFRMESFLVASRY